MALLGSFKINKAINLLLMSQQTSPAEIKEAVAKIKDGGSSAVPKLIEALSEDTNNQHINKLLIELLNNKSLPEYIDALADDNKNIVTGIMKVLASASSYDPNKLFELFEDPDIPNNVLIHILLARHDKLNANNLFALMAKVDSNAKKAILHVIDEIATESMIPQLAKHVSSGDVNVRFQITKTLSKFNTEQTRNILIEQLKDNSKNVRQAAIEGLGNLTVTVPAAPLCQALKDPDMNVQAKAIDALTHNKDKSLIKYLVDVLQDESEYVRRAAVEVLNEVCDPRSIKDLLNAMRDSDWWVKVRAADALGSIGGPKVVDAVLELITDKDEFMRRTAVEILNSIKDERAFDHLVKALKDDDWWVRERAADALTKLGDKRSVNALVDMMENQSDSSSIAIKALGELGDDSAIQPLINYLNTSDGTTQKEIIRALEQLSNPDNSEQIQEAIAQASGSTGNISTVSQVEDMDTLAVNLGQNLPSSTSANTGTMEIIDPESLEPGTVIQDRYEVIKKIGKGAFGVVLLVKDKMVNEEIILKFLNPHMVSDQTIVDRFVHELRFSRKLTHKNIIRIFDFITFGKSYAISMEYFKSHSLSAEIKKRKQIDNARYIKIIIDICKGLSVAHAAEVVHRDIKPANILINDQDVVKIVDFGLAAATITGDSRMTKSGVLVGTPTYMAPEQVRGRAIDTRTDIYSLGIVMYELFTGKPPYKGEDHMGTLFMHVEGGAEPPSTVNPKISTYLDNIIMKAIHVDPSLRYQKIDELRRDLVMALAKEAS